MGQALLDGLRKKRKKSPEGVDTPGAVRHSEPMNDAANRTEEQKQKDAEAALERYLAKRGNRRNSDVEPEGRHFRTWED